MRAGIVGGEGGGGSSKRKLAGISSGSDMIKDAGTLACLYCACQRMGACLGYARQDETEVLYCFVQCGNECMVFEYVLGF